MIERREFVRRLFAIGASFTAGGLLVRQGPAIIRDFYTPEEVARLWRESDAHLNGRLVQMERHRRMPPGQEFYVDPKALRRLGLHDDDLIVHANAEADEAVDFIRDYEAKREQLFRHGQLWATIPPRPDAFEAVGTFRVRNLFDR